MSAPIDVIVLAGDRGPDDPLAQSAAVQGKALVPVAGRGMLTRVLDVLTAWPRLGRLILVAPVQPEYRAAVAASGLDVDADVIWIRPEASLCASVEAGRAAVHSAVGLLVTADHVLLDRRWLDRLVQAAEERASASLLVGVTDWHGVMARFPGSRRTRYRFSDRSICGTNLFALRPPGIERLLAAWQAVEQQRKRPWRIIGLLGWANLAAYLAGRLSMAGAFRSLSVRLDLDIEPVLMADPLTAVDVDSLADLELVESALALRDGPSC